MDQNRVGLFSLNNIDMIVMILIDEIRSFIVNQTIETGFSFMSLLDQTSSDLSESRH